MASGVQGGGQGLSESRVRTVRVTTGSIAGAGEADVTATFATAFADDSYTVTAVVELDQGGEDMRVRRVRTKAAGQCVVNVVNNAIVSRTGILHVICVHD